MDPERLGFFSVPELTALPYEPAGPAEEGGQTGAQGWVDGLIWLKLCLMRGLMALAIALHHGLQPL
jgi:hypothetical protein